MLREYFLLKSNIWIKSVLPRLNYNIFFYGIVFIGAFCMCLYGNVMQRLDKLDSIFAENEQVIS